MINECIILASDRQFECIDDLYFTPILCSKQSAENCAMSDAMCADQRYTHALNGSTVFFCSLDLVQ